MSTAKHTAGPLATKGRRPDNVRRIAIVLQLRAEDHSVIDETEIAETQDKFDLAKLTGKIRPYCQQGSDAHDKLVDTLKECVTDLKAHTFSQEGDLLETIDMLRLRLKTINNTIGAALALAEPQAPAQAENQERTGR